jgi:transcription elongation GreA/GreB family factor
MVHLEMEKLAKQLEEGRRQLAEVEKYHHERIAESGQVQMGSLVQTTTGWYYLITSLGKLTLNGETCFVLSGASPLGRMMMEKRVGDEIVRDGKEVRIVGVF